MPALLLVTTDPETLARGLEQLGGEYRQFTASAHKSTRDAAYDFGVITGYQMAAKGLREGHIPPEKLVRFMNYLAEGYKANRMNGLAGSEQAEYERGVLFGLISSKKIVSDAVEAVTDPASIARKVNLGRVN